MRFIGNFTSFRCRLGAGFGSMTLNFCPSIACLLLHLAAAVSVVVLLQATETTESRKRTPPSTIEASGFQECGNLYEQYNGRYSHLGLARNGGMVYVHESKANQYLYYDKSCSNALGNRWFINIISSQIKKPDLNRVSNLNEDSECRSRVYTNETQSSNIIDMLEGKSHWIIEGKCLPKTIKFKAVKDPGVTSTALIESCTDEKHDTLPSCSDPKIPVEFIIKVLADQNKEILRVDEGNEYASGTGWSNDLVKSYLDTDCKDAGAKKCFHGPFIRSYFGNSGKNRESSLLKTFGNLPEHNRVYIGLKYFAVNHWDPGEKAYIKIDGVIRWSKDRPKTHSCEGWSKLVDDILTNGDGVKCYIDVNLVLEHTKDSVTVEVGGDISDDDDNYITNKYWAFNSFKLETMQASNDHNERPGFAIGDGWSNDLVTSHDNKMCRQSNCYHGPFAPQSQGANNESFISKTFGDLPPHNKVRISLRYFAVDSWDQEVAYVKIDDQEKWSKIGNWKFNCSGWKEFKGALYNPSKYKNPCYDDVIIYTSHASDQIHITVGATINQFQRDEYWAFDSFELETIWENSRDEKPGYAIGIGWSNSLVRSHTNSDCGQNKCYHGPFSKGSGGANNASSISKIFRNLPPHKGVLISLRYFAIDTWNDDEHAYFEIDDQEQWIKGREKSDSCQGWKNFEDDIYQPYKFKDVPCYEEVERYLDHTADNVKVTVGATITENHENEYWAFDSFKLETIQESNNYNERAGFATVSGWSNSLVKSHLNRDCKQINCYHGPFGSSGDGHVTSFIYKEFNKLPVHNRVRISLRYFAVDSWDYGERAYVKIGDREGWSRGRTSFKSCRGWKNFEGRIYKKAWACYEDVVIYVDHTANRIKVVVGATIDESIDNGYWAFDSFKIDFIDTRILYKCCNTFVTATACMPGFSIASHETTAFRTCKECDGVGKNSEEKKLTCKMKNKDVASTSSQTYATSTLSPTENLNYSPLLTNSQAISPSPPLHLSIPPSISDSLPITKPFPLDITASLAPLTNLTLNSGATKSSPSSSDEALTFVGIGIGGLFFLFLALLIHRCKKKEAQINISQCNDQRNITTQNISTRNPVLGLKNISDKNELGLEQLESIYSAEWAYDHVPIKQDPLYSEISEYLDPMTLNPDHDSGNAALYSVFPAPRKIYSNGQKEQETTMEKIKREKEDGNFDKVRLEFEGLVDIEPSRNGKIDLSINHQERNI